MTGPPLGILIGKGASSSFNGRETDTSLDDTFNTFNFAWVFGLGSSYALTHTLNVDLGLRYSMGLTNVLSHPADGESTNLNSFQILAGLALAI